MSAASRLDWRWTRARAIPLSVVDCACLAIKNKGNETDD